MHGGPHHPTQADVMTPKAKKQLELVYIHCAMNMAVSILNFSTRSELLKEVLLKTGVSGVFQRGACH
jgi:hypothetical protein